MEHAFWHKKWEKGEIGFHKTGTHPLLAAHFGALALEKGARVFVPLCGKTLDILWFRQQGYRVVAVELSALAVDSLFEALGITPQITTAGALRHYHADGIDVFAGDVFALSQEQIGTVDAVYDRAALVALPEGMRKRYAAHVTAITGQVPQILITFDYVQSEMKGPPFSIPLKAVESLYSAAYDIAPLASVPVEGGLKGQCAALEEVWLLRAR